MGYLRRHSTLGLGSEYVLSLEICTRFCPDIGTPIAELRCVLLIELIEIIDECSSSH